MMSSASRAIPRFKIVAAAAALAVVGGGAALVASRDNPKPPVAEPGSMTPNGSSALCVELYSLESLAKRAIAFDGTVASVNDDEITFTLVEPFKGVQGTSITLKGALTLGGITSAGDGVPLEPGSRLLVAGDDDFAWGCGFTQPYDAQVAQEWRAALKS